jgi:hypothetical protein
MANSRNLKVQFNNFTLTTALNPIPFFILPLLEKIGLAQWRMTFMLRIGLMMPGMSFKVLLVSVITRKATYKSPERFDFA